MNTERKQFAMNPLSPSIPKQLGNMNDNFVEKLDEREAEWERKWNLAFGRKGLANTLSSELTEEKTPFGVYTTYNIPGDKITSSGGSWRKLGKEKRAENPALQQETPRIQADGKDLGPEVSEQKPRKQSKKTPVEAQKIWKELVHEERLNKRLKIERQKLISVLSQILDKKQKEIPIPPPVKPAATDTIIAPDVTVKDKESEKTKKLDKIKNAVKKHPRRTIAEIIGAGLLTAAIIFAARSCDSSPTVGPERTPTPSAATGTPTPRPTEMPTLTPTSEPTPKPTIEATKTPTPTPMPTERPTAVPTPTTIPATEIDRKSIRDTELAKLRLQSLRYIEEHMALRIIQTPEEAAERFGDDSYSINPRHWGITRFGAELIPNPDGSAARLTSNEGFLTGKVNNEIRLVFPPNVDKRFVREGTIWNHPEDSIIEADQPGVNTFWVCQESARPSEFIPLAQRLTQREAAERFGGDEYSKNPNNWITNEYGGATLQPNPSGKLSRLHNLTRGTIAEGWWRVKQNSENTNFDAIAFVTSPNIETVILAGGTIWIFPEDRASEGSTQLLHQLKDREQAEQPGVPVYLLCNYVPVEICIPSYR